MNRFRQFWSDLRASFWFVPSIIVMLSILLAVVLVKADFDGAGLWQQRWPRVFGSNAAGARGMLSTIAGSMMTVVGVTFSMTLVTLALASSQYTSRILRNFMSDRITQVVLGIFTGIFVYCLIVLRTIRGGEDSPFIPSLAVTFGVVLAVGGIGALIFFIHHIASSIQASSIIASVADETMEAVKRLFPGTIGAGSRDEEQEAANSAFTPPTWQTIPAGQNGYIQNVDIKALLRLALEHNTVIKMEYGIGAFVIADGPLLSLALDAAPEEQAIEKFQSAFSISRHRTLEQDAAFGIRQIVDIALRALSPGINDTTTSVMCVDYLTAILARLACRVIPSPLRYENGVLRVIAKGHTFAEFAGEAFDQIRGSSQGNTAIMLRMVEALELIATLTASPARRRVLHDHVTWIAELAERTIASRPDLERFQSELKRVFKVFDLMPA